MRLHAPSRLGWAARGMSPLLCALTLSAAIAAPAGAEPTTSITSASCDVAGMIAVSWSGKTPYSYTIALTSSLGIAGRAEGLVPKPNDDSLTLEFSSPLGAAPIIIWLYGKPHGNTVPSYPYHGELKDMIEIPCT